MKTVKDADKGQSLLPDTSKADHREETMSLPDQICKAEALWALKTARDDFSFHASDGFPQLLQRMCPDSEIAKGVKISCTKVSYVIGHELGPYFLQKTDNILNTPRTYFTLHFDETSQIKKQLDVLVRYYRVSSYPINPIKSIFLELSYKVLYFQQMSYKSYIFNKNSNFCQ